MMNAGMAMVKNRVPLDIMIYRCVMGGDAWTRGSVDVAWKSHGISCFTLFPLKIRTCCLHFQLQSASTLSQYSIRGRLGGIKEYSSGKYTRIPI
jgi:hypothetical protein